MSEDITRPLTPLEMAQLAHATEHQLSPAGVNLLRRAMFELDALRSRPNPQKPQYSIGSHLRPGLGKLAEECGELLTVVGKLIATGGSYQYYDGRDLSRELFEELADCMAAIHFFVGANGFDEDGIVKRAEAKLKQFIEWHHAQISTGIPLPQREAHHDEARSAPIAAKPPRGRGDRQDGS